MDCIFCKIIKGDIPSYTIYEDEIVKVILDINPVSNGHMLIIPKTHYVNLMDIDDSVLSHIMNISKDLYKKYKDKLNMDGVTITQNNDYGQEVKHYHLHLIPRYENDNIEFIKPTNLDSVEDVYKKMSE
mgnify:FL=1